ncbi:MAG: alpha/beta hydrolase [Lachnospiraceae bacterium]|nr:alpha/beta hydrolase [Lachnospiraceae bacterium]
MSETSEKCRRDFAKGDAERDAGLTTPKDIIRYDDISYGEDEKYNLLDVYRPRAAGDKKLPVILNIHGGGWVYGDKEVYQFYAMSLAQRGFAVVNFNYRLSPEHRFPTHIEDICAAFSWTVKNKDRYGFDTDNLFAVGDSAGGHLLGLFAALVTDPGYRKELSDQYPQAVFDCEDIKLRAIALNCGKYDLSKSDIKDENTPKLIVDLFEHGGDEKELHITNVLEKITGDYPPVFLMTCPGDFLRDQAVYMTEALVNNKVPFVFRYYGNEENPLHHVFHCNVRLSDGIKCNDDECAFFREYMKEP